MGKKSEMFRTFLKVMSDDQLETKKVIPNKYYKSFYDIDVDYLIKKGIINLIIDIDGTLLPVDDISVPKKLIDKIQVLINKNINICLMSNNSKQRVLPVAQKLDVFYLYEAKKPLKEAFDNALKILNVSNKETVAMIGDQMLSDIKGANEYNIYSILVDPVSKRNKIQTKTQRILQDIIEKHLKKKNIFNKHS